MGLQYANPLMHEPNDQQPGTQDCKAPKTFGSLAYDSSQFP